MFGDAFKVFSTDSEPALSAYGISKAIELAETNYGTDRFKKPSFPIAVSPLIRTWETAVLLYGYQPYRRNVGINDIDLELRICPWLKETGFVGNDPKPLAHSIVKFIKFLNALLVDDFQKHNYTIRSITICIPPINTPEDEVPSAATRNNWQKIKIERNVNKSAYEFSDDKFCKIVDTVYDRYGYQKEKGDLMNFMKWYRLVVNDIGNLETVHIVAHSNIMQEFVETTLHSEVPNNIKNENCWTITVPYYNEYNEDQSIEIVSSIQPGFPNPDKHPDLINGARAMEAEKATSLCGKSGSVKPYQCASGGRRTRRKRNRRKKTRRHRR
jgi:hypothetical protein